MNIHRFRKHVKLWMRNLKSKRVKRCVECPWEDEIVGEYPEMRELFKQKRKELDNAGDVQ